MMKKFLEYLYKYNPSLKEQKFKGASQQEIDHLESLIIEHAGVGLPNIYREFLEIFGHDSDVLELCSEGSTDIDHVIEFYTEEILYDHETSIPGVIRISSCGQFPERVLGLNCTSNPEKPTVVDIDYDDISLVLSDSFDNYLFQTVEMWDNCSKYSKVIDFKGDVKNEVGSINHFLTQKIGYDELPFSDSIRPWFKKANSVISCWVSSKSEHVGLSIQFNSSDLIELNKLEEFLLSIGMHKSQYRERLGNN